MDTMIIGVDFGEDIGDRNVSSVMCGNCGYMLDSGIHYEKETVKLVIPKKCTRCGISFKNIVGNIE